MLWAGGCYEQQSQVALIDVFFIYRDSVMRSGGPLLPFIHNHQLILQHVMYCPMLQGSVHNSQKLETSQLLHGWHTHQTLDIQFEKYNITTQTYLMHLCFYSL